MQTNMKTKWMTLPLVASLLVSGIVGCGPEVVALSAAATQIAPIAGTIGGTVYLVKTIEGMSLDNEKKSLEIQALQNSNTSRP